MPKYTPIVTPASVIAVESNLVQFNWKDKKLFADFLISKADPRHIRVHFYQAEIIRLVDEMPLSTEDDKKKEGLVKNNFAYVVENGKFWNSQSEAFKIIHPKIKHYCFVTGWMCLDVISDQEPNFEIIASDQAILI